MGVWDLLHERLVEFLGVLVLVWLCVLVVMLSGQCKSKMPADLLLADTDSYNVADGTEVVVRAAACTDRVTEGETIIEDNPHPPAYVDAVAGAMLVHRP